MLLSTKNVRVSEISTVHAGRSISKVAAGGAGAGDFYYSVNVWLDIFGEYLVDSRGGGGGRQPCTLKGADLTLNLELDSRRGLSAGPTAKDSKSPQLVKCKNL